MLRHRVERHQREQHAPDHADTEDIPVTRDVLHIAIARAQLRDGARQPLAVRCRGHARIAPRRIERDVAIADRVGEAAGRRRQHHVGERAVERVARENRGAERAVARTRVESPVEHRRDDVPANGWLVLRKPERGGDKGGEETGGHRDADDRAPDQLFTVPAPACHHAPAVVGARLKSMINRGCKHKCDDQAGRFYR